MISSAPTPPPDRDPNRSGDSDTLTTAEQSETPPVAPLTSRGRRRAPGRRARRRRAIRIAALVVVALLAVPSVSLVSALRAPGNTTTTEKAVEWMRDHGLGSVVNKVENWWFGNQAPKTGGEPDRAIAAPTETTPQPPVAAPVDHTPKPDDIATPAASALPNEGVWQPVGPLVNGLPATYTTQIRPDAVHTSLLAGLAWMDPKLLRFELHPGLQEPGGSWTTPAQVPPEQRLDLVAAFNGGFRMNDANGGFYLDGVERRSLRDGAASLVITSDGRATVGQWGRDVRMTPDVVAVRQNLKLIVDGGQPVAGLDNNANGAWGDTLGNRVLVWRSGVCVDRNGGLVYGYGNGLGALSLAEMLQRAGCDRAMELDINPSWTTFNLYAPTAAGDPSSVSGTKLLPDQNKGGNRYLADDSRDFVAVLVRKP